MADCHPDFNNKSWCRELLRDPDIAWSTEVPRELQGGLQVSNSMFAVTLSTDRALRARVAFRRPCKAPDAIRQTEDCWLVSIGDGLDGKAGRAHGGFNAMILDQVTGSCAHHTVPNPNPPATATMTVDYKAPIDTPAVLLARAWVIELTGRKIWVRAVIEDGDGKVLATAKCLFVSARTSAL